MSASDIGLGQTLDHLNFSAHFALNPSLRTCSIENPMVYGKTREINEPTDFLLTTCEQNRHSILQMSGIFFNFYQPFSEIFTSEAPKGAKST